MQKQSVEVRVDAPRKVILDVIHFTVADKVLLWSSNLEA